MPDDPDDDLPSGEGLDVGAIAAALLRGWRLIVLSTACAFLITVYGLHHAVYIYTAQMQVTQPQNSTQNNQSSNIGSALGGLASLASVALPGTQNASQFRLYSDSLQSRDLADELAKNQALMQHLFADSWDTRTNSWREPPRGSFYDLKVWIRALLGLAPLQSWHPPDGADVRSFMDQYLIVQDNVQKPYLVTITFSSSNREFAVKFLNLVNQTADNMLRQKALRRTRDYINYLSNKLDTVTLAEHKLAIVQSLSEQEKYEMVASSGAPFSAEMFEHPWAPTLADSPKPSRTLLMNLAIGFGIGAAFVYLLATYGAPFYQWLGRRRWWKATPLFLRRVIEPEAGR